MLTPTGAAHKKINGVNMDIRITGALDLDANKQHIPHAFTVPPNATKLYISMTYVDLEPVDSSYDTQISLTVFDPEGARGARHCNADQTLTLTAHTSTPGYTPGALLPGTWTVWIDTHRLVVPLRYTIEIAISTEPISETPVVYAKGSTAPRGRGWYRGDLHSHTLHSDAEWDVPDLVQWAREQRLDFVTLTDHNTVSALAQLDSLADDSLLTIGGVELTGYNGHALALGTRRWMEWRAGLNNQTMPMLAQAVMDAGALFVIAHPMALGDPYCTGCDWTHPDMMPGNARIVEIWNYLWGLDSNNDQAVSLWYEWLNQGYRMVATRGTDIHGPIADAPENIGFDVVYAEALSEAAILDAIRRGHLYLSAGPTLELTATNADGQTAMMGDLIGGDSVEVRLAWTDALPGDQMRVIVNGVCVEEMAIASEGTYTRTLRTPDARWCVFEVRAEDGSMRAITNPIYLGREADWR